MARARGRRLPREAGRRARRTRDAMTSSLKQLETPGTHAALLGARGAPTTRNSKERVQVVNHPNFNRGGGTFVSAAHLSYKYPVFPLWSRDWTDERGKAHKSKSPAT